MNKCKLNNCSYISGNRTCYMDVSKYWRERGPTYFQELNEQPSYQKKRLVQQENFLLSHIANFKFKSILEIGCGSGRYTKILSTKFKPETYFAIDISKGQIEKAREYVNDDKIEFICTEIQNLKLDRKFDLVFAGEVLMHINFDEIEGVIQKTISYSKNKIISIDWYNENNIGCTGLDYCFIHDYRTLFTKNNVKECTIYKIPLSLKLKIINMYALLRQRTGIDQQGMTFVSI